MSEPASVPSPAPSRARRILRILGRALLGLVAALLLFAGFVYWKSERGMHQRFQVQGEALAIPTDPESIARGERLAATKGCMDCHGADGAGRDFLHAMPVMDILAPNVTSAGRTAHYTDRDWTRAIRHGVRPDGSPILFMPAGDFRFVDDADLGAIVAYVKSLPPVRNEVGPLRVGPVGRLLYVLGKLPLVPAELVDHDATITTTPPAGPTAEYGRYLANACIGCHGEGLSGGHIPGTPPEWPDAANLTPDETGLRDASEAQFRAALTQGRRIRRGGTIDPMHMPWRQLARLTDDEQQALWLYLRSVPAKPVGQR